jgi:archaellum component FlaF (FlaF/FlaG flagellin family)
LPTIQSAVLRVCTLSSFFLFYLFFLFKATNGVYHPNRNRTDIRIYSASNDTLLWQVDYDRSPLVLYTGTIVAFRIPNPPWIPGESYYVLVDSGTVNGNVFCGPESAPISGR